MARSAASAHVQWCTNPWGREMLSPPNSEATAPMPATIILQDAQEMVAGHRIPPKGSRPAV
jgi:hypothetical protein